MAPSHSSFFSLPFSSSSSFFAALLFFLGPKRKRHGSANGMGKAGNAETTQRHPQQHAGRDDIGKNKNKNDDDNEDFLSTLKKKKVYDQHIKLLNHEFKDNVRFNL